MPIPPGTKTVGTKRYNGGHKKITVDTKKTTLGTKEQSMVTSAELVVRKPNPMDPASDTPLHEQMYECAGLPYEILIPHDIGPESFEEQNKFAEKPKDEQMAIQYQREEYLKEHVPMGPYPVQSKGQGWALLFLEEEATYPSFTCEIWRCKARH